MEMVQRVAGDAAFENARARVLFGKAPLIVPSLHDIETAKKREEEKKEAKANPIEENLKQLVLMVHGSALPKQKLVDEFMKLYPDCVKTALEKKLKEITHKDKGEGLKKRLFVSKEILEKLVS